MTTLKYPPPLYFRLTQSKWWLIGALLAIFSLGVYAEDKRLGVPFKAPIPQGKTRLIITLKAPEQPAGEFSGVQSVAEQRSAIEFTKTQFLNELQQSIQVDGISGVASTVEVEKEFETIPSLVMEASDAMIDKILESSLVADIAIDEIHPPTLFDSTVLIGANEVWDQGYTGAGQVVVVLDTGVDKNHPALKNKIIQEACYSTTSTAYNASSVCPNGEESQEGNGAGMACASEVDGCDHGTHVAGIIAAEGSVTGAAKGAQVIAIQVFSRFDNPDYCGSPSCALSFTSDQIAALEHVYKLRNNGMDIAAVNMSLGSGKYAQTCSSSLQSIIQNLRSVGVATLVASGNEGYTDGIASPACVEGAISVGATTKSDTVASYSNSTNILDLLAPGSYITSTVLNGKDSSKSGTSMATPHVAAAFAILKEADSSASVDKLENILKQTGKDIEDYRNNITKPRIDLVKALKRLAPSTSEPAIEVAPTSLYFGNVTVGESFSKTITISNQGESELEIDQLSTDNADFEINTDNCSNTNLPAGQSCIVTVIFKPSNPGRQKATLQIPSNDPDTATVEVSLIGKGIESNEPDIEVTPMYYGFGRITIGESSDSATITISNQGKGSLEIGVLSVDNTDFNLDTGNCSETRLAAGESCTVTVTFTPSVVKRQNAILLIPSNDPDTEMVEVGLTGRGIKKKVTNPTQASCLLYGVNDKGVNNSQFFTIDLNTFEVNSLGKLWEGYDIEALAIHPTTNIIYAASSDQATNGKKGHLYKVDAQTGELISVGATGFDDIEDLAFSADGKLRAFAKGTGIITIDSTGVGTVETASTLEVEGFTSSKQSNTLFYGSVGQELWTYDSSTNELTQPCLGFDFGGETEALEMMADGSVLFGIHNDKTFKLHVLDPMICDMVFGRDVDVSPYKDVEGLAMPTAVCEP